MPFDFAQAKASARRVVHATFGVQAFYKDASMNAQVETRARLHTRLARPFGDLNDGGYTEIIEGIDRIVLIPESIDGYPITLRKAGVMTFPTMFPDVRFVLEHEHPADGPLEQSWAVSVLKA